MNLWLSLFAGFFVLIAAISMAVLRVVDASHEARIKAMLDSIDPQEPKVTTSVMIQPGPARNRGLEQLLERTPGLDWVPLAVRRMGPEVEPHRASGGLDRFWGGRFLCRHQVRAVVRSRRSGGGSLSAGGRAVPLSPP